MNLYKEIGKSKGHFNSKENRAQKLVDAWDSIEQKMIGFIERGKGESITARCAYGVLLIMETGIRVGNEESANGYIPVKTEFVKVNGKFTPVKKFNKESKQYLPIPKFVNVTPRYVVVDKKFVNVKNVPQVEVRTYGLSTLLIKHVVKTSSKLCFSFVGKKAVKNRLCTSHKTLLKYYNDVHNGSKANDRFLKVSYEDLFDFIKTYIGKGFSPKDLRTAKANLLFLEELETKEHQLRVGLIEKKSDVNKALSMIVENVAETIGHTKGVCKSAYISKQLFESYKKTLNQILIARKFKGGK